MALISGNTQVYPVRIYIDAGRVHECSGNTILGEYRSTDDESILGLQEGVSLEHLSLINMYIIIHVTVL